MRCSSYSPTNEYDMGMISQHFKGKQVNYQLIDGVIHYDYSKDSKKINVFIFGFGCVIIWGAGEEEEINILAELKPYEIGALPNLLSEFIFFAYNEQDKRSYIDEEKNLIILGDDSDLIKMSVSYALAQSVKLNLLEQSVSESLDKVKPIQKELATKGSVSLSKKELSKQIGVLFNERYTVNLYSDVLDTPEFFWRRPSYEPLYLMTIEFQDIQIRQNILNNRLNMIHELYSILSDEMNHKHSTRLEIIIVFLITIEVLLALSHNEIFLKWLSNLLI